MIRLYVAHVHFAVNQIVLDFGVGLKINSNSIFTFHSINLIVISTDFKTEKSTAKAMQSERI